MKLAVGHHIALLAAWLLICAGAVYGLPSIAAALIAAGSSLLVIVLAVASMVGITDRPKRSDDRSMPTPTRGVSRAPRKES